MPLTKTKGNMYPWVTHMVSPIHGQCPHRCGYCYVEHTTAYRTGIYKGKLRLNEKCLTERWGKGKVPFICHMTDMWADAIPEVWIFKILEQCCRWPDNEYVFQTKNPRRYYSYLDRLPPKRILGCTIETDNRRLTSSSCPCPIERVGGMLCIHRREKTFITIEPVMAFSPNFADLIISCKPDFVNIGADSKGHHLPEPNAEDVEGLIASLTIAGIELREKHNLDRILKA